MMKRTCAFVLFLFLVCPLFAQQSVQFSQYVFNGLTVNPAYAGYRDATNVNLTYRNQWTGLTGAPKTISASIDGISKRKKMGFGFQVIDDSYGAQSNLTAFLSYAYKIKVSDKASVSFGLAAGINQYALDGSVLFPLDPDPHVSNTLQNTFKPDAKVGIFYANDRYFAAASACDLLSNAVNASPVYYVVHQSRHYYLQTGALWRLNGFLKFKPTVMLKSDFKAPVNLDLNTFLIFENKFWLGFSYRTSVGLLTSNALPSDLSGSDAISVLIEYNINSRLRIGYSYDYSVNHLKDVNNGAHEISIGYKFIKHFAPMLTPRYF